MKVTVQLFAALREVTGTRQVELEVPPDATVRQAAEMLASRYPRLAPYLDSVSFAVDGEFVTGGTVLEKAGELALLPPVSGG